MIRVDYAGAGGSCLGIKSLGLEVVGVEMDKWSCQTRASNNMPTVVADLSVETISGEQFAGYWASPPCQTFSNAGAGEGLSVKDRLFSAIQDSEWGAINSFDSKTKHVAIAARTAITGDFGWVVMEQVPSVLPAWEAIGRDLQTRGYSVWSGLLNAADFGVPQNRRRAFLLASATKHVVPPTPTHAAASANSDLPLHVSWGEALGLGQNGADFSVREGLVKLQRDRVNRPVVAQPLPNADGADSMWWLDRRQRSKGKWARLIPSCEPSPTVTAVAVSKSQWIIRDGKLPSTGDPRYKLGVKGAKVLQGFPENYGLCGPISAQLQQIGNAVPPILAAKCVEAVK